MSQIHSKRTNLFVDCLDIIKLSAIYPKPLNCGNMELP